MKRRHLGAYVNVRVSRVEVEAFKRTWPCSGLPDRAITFQFQKSNGDLVDLWGAKDYDGADLLALSHDAGAFALATSTRPDVGTGR